jgi:hypothetical protein
VYKELREGKAAITRKGPGETGHRRDDTDTGSEANGRDGALHGIGRFRGLGRLVEDLDDGEAGGRFQRVLHISDAEKQNQHEGECEDAVDRDGLDENPRNDPCRVANLLAHVNGAIEAFWHRPLLGTDSRA